MLYFLAGVAVGAALLLPLWGLYRRRRRLRLRAAEARARHAERLAYVGTLAGGLAHEIKNPLSTLTLNLQLLQEDWQRPESPKEMRLVKKLDILLSETRRLEEALNDFLRFARGEKPNFAEGDVNALVDELAAFVEPEAARLNIRIRRHCDASAPRCWMDGNLIRQALLNIVVNAKQAMPDGGELMIATRDVPAGVAIEITDTGEGIPPDRIERIFEAYYSTKKTGSGLGLATTKRIVDQHHAAINVHSEAGKGTRFTIRLPHRPPAD